MTTEAEMELLDETDTAQADAAETAAVEQQADDDPIEVAEVVSLPVRAAEIVPVSRDDEYRGLAQLAVTLSGAQIVPKALRGKPHDTFAVLLTGQELGVAAMTAVRNFHVIDGQVTIPPKWKLAAVRSSGLGKVYPHEGPRPKPCPVESSHTSECLCAGSGMVEQVCPCGSREPDNDAERAVWHGERKDTPGIIFTSGYTIQEAQTAGLAGKDNWKHYPARMLSHRAAGYLLDDAFSEVATGMYSPDELGAVTDKDGNVIDVDSTESLIPSKPKAESPPIQPDVLADFKRRIEKLTPDAKAGLLAAYKERQLPVKLDDLRYSQQTVMDALVVAAEQKSKTEAAEPEPETAEPQPTAEATEATEDPAQAPDTPATTEPVQPPPFDPDGLPEGNSPDDDEVWADRAPDEWVAEAITTVQEMDAPEVKSRAKAAGLPASGDAATIRARLTARVIRRRMERAL